MSSISYGTLVSFFGEGVRNMREETHMLGRYFCRREWGPNLEDTMNFSEESFGFDAIMD